MAEILSVIWFYSNLEVDVGVVAGSEGYGVAGVDDAAGMGRGVAVFCAVAGAEAAGQAGKVAGKAEGCS